MLTAALWLIAATLHVFALFVAFGTGVSYGRDDTKAGLAGMTLISLIFVAMGLTVTMGLPS